MELNLNGRRVQVSAPAEKPLLWVLREDLQLTGTKFGCGIGACRACTVLVESEAQASCTLTLGDVEGRHVTTIEGIATHSLHAVQRAWIAKNVPQCGYCQPGMIISVVALLASKPRPTQAEIEQGVPNLCRCGTYDRIRAAIASVTGGPE